MELEHRIRILGFFVTTVLSEVTVKEFTDREWDFIYGSQEYNNDLKLTLKQFKRIWKRRALK